MRKAVVVVAVLSAVPLLMAARPGTEQQLIQQLNGQPVRWVLPDGGRSGIFASASTARVCMTLTGATTNINGATATVVPNVLLVTALTAGNLCIRPSTSSTSWDGGCNYIPGDENYGVPLPVGVPQYITPDSKATAVCFAGDAGSVAVPVWWAQ